MSIEIKVNVTAGLVAAILLGEFLSFVWYSDNTPWGRRGSERHFLSAILADVGLAVILQWIMGSLWRVSKPEDAVWLAVGLALLYACLEGPHAIYSAHSTSAFFFHTLHKFVLVLTMVLTLWYLKDYKF